MVWLPNIVQPLFCSLKLMWLLVHGPVRLLKGSYSTAVSSEVCEGRWVVDSRLQSVSLHAHTEENNDN